MPDMNPDRDCGLSGSLYNKRYFVEDSADDLDAAIAQL